MGTPSNNDSAAVVAPVGQRVKKLWGHTTCLLRTPAIEIWRAEIVAGGFSSWHLHARKSNLFIVESGKLQIDMRIIDLVIGSEKLLLPGDGPFTVWHGLQHRFLALVETSLIEVYQPAFVGESVDPSDIVRFSEGGVTSDGKFS